MIPFSPPRIDQRVIDEVTAALKSGWITTGPRTKQFEKEITAYCGNKTTVAVNSWTAGMEVLLNWWGIGEGDEVILPAYTYCASANVIIHSGAKPVMVDLNPEDFNMSVEAVRKAITPRTKAIMPVDIAGFPCDYDALYALVESVKDQFQPGSEFQKQLGRILILADAAHSFGATVNGKRSGSLADITCFSFHAVKNLSTAEGGAMLINLPDSFDHEAIYKELCIKILHGQSKDALAKAQKGNWRYDVMEPGFKCNMTDIQAALGLVELDRYQENMDRRKEIFRQYDAGFTDQSWAIKPLYKTADRETCYHLYLLRIAGATESQRDAIMQAIFDQDVSVNVHFQPLPILTAYKSRGYNMADYPEAWNKYSNEITLPVYFDLTDAQVQTVIKAVKQAVKQVMG
ncbi:MAG: capsular biosynthesis protein [Candidatus Fluviicola riflensis]|nr:MAG: capsular biosynthesis protein [Candidatus Fluviicola riflensis]OGS76692.1 MAG: capsular biosynthesis protein [Candidatus Fluviicola riflensis]OGS82953.1 MAG: capsular biosynthesis protein [Fluviicola sp. RIFCSPHIGHO2_01_FULL_43_53]OGS88423.1 MAG: capsular biosynthesis protein [Fluviicola sp. RIFCSPHIGHO2_12_FULL_43_24]